MSDHSTDQNPQGRAPTRRLSGQDAIFVYTETPTMPMHTMGTVILDGSAVPGGFGFDEIVRTVASRIHTMPPFRQRLVEVPMGLGHPILADDPEFRLENHLHRIAVPAPGSLRELASVVADIAGRPLDRHQPLWEMWVIEGLAEGRTALVTKLHHCMIDGASGSSQMAQLMDLEPDPPPSEPPERWNPPPLPSALDLARESAGSRLIGPGRLGRLIVDTVQGIRSRQDAQRATARPGEEPPPSSEEAPRTQFNRAISNRRSVAYGSAALDDLKFVKNTFGVTVNDAVLAACSLALRSYLQERDDLPEQPLHCMVPVSLKSTQEKQEFSNKVSTMTVRLPTHRGSPEEVIRFVQRETADAKAVFQAVEDDLIPEWLELTPPLLAAAGARLYSEWNVADRFGIPSNLVVSNMMGPPIPLFFGGARVEAVYPMGPVAEGMGLNVTVLSNMGRLDIGVLACRECVPEPQEIADGFNRAVAELHLAAEKKRAT